MSVLARIELTSLGRVEYSRISSSHHLVSDYFVRPNLAQTETRSMGGERVQAIYRLAPHPPVYPSVAPPAPSSRSIRPLLLPRPFLPSFPPPSLPRSLPPSPPPTPPTLAVVYPSAGSCAGLGGCFTKGGTWCSVALGERVPWRPHARPYSTSVGAKASAHFCCGECHLHKRVLKQRGAVAVCALSAVGWLAGWLALGHSAAWPTLRTLHAPIDKPDRHQLYVRTDGESSICGDRWDG